MRLVVVFIVFFLSLAEVQAFDGWTSGGGDLLRDSQNPWFIQNTPVVRYCVLVDEKNFGVERNQISDFITRAFIYWKAELSLLPSTYVGGHFQIRTGTQTFTEVECTEDADIRFQFGVLSEKQHKKLGSTNEIVGIAVRTEYDQLNLRGKGFIYVSPDSGPLKMKLDNVHKEVWHLAKGALLYPTLLHEIGHVFGVRHISGNDSAFMDERYLERIVQDKHPELWAAVWSEIYRLRMEPGFFKFQTETLVPTICQKPRALILDFFEVDPALSCYKVAIQNNLLSIYAGTAGDKLELMGQADLESKDSPEGESVVNFYLSPSQKIFPKSSSSASFFPLGYSHKVFFKGKYKSENGKSQKDVILQVSPTGNKQFSGQIEGKTYVDINLGF